MTEADKGDTLDMREHDSCQLTFTPKISRWGSFLYALGLGTLQKIPYCIIVVQRINIVEGHPNVRLEFVG